MNFKKHLFHSISMTYHVNLTKQGLPKIRVNYITSVSIKHFNGFVVFCFCLLLILRSCIFDDFASIFGCSQLNHP